MRNTVPRGWNTGFHQLRNVCIDAEYRMGKQGNQRNDRQYDAGAQTDMAADKRADLSGITPSDGIADQALHVDAKAMMVMNGRLETLRMMFDMARGRSPRCSTKMKNRNQVDREMKFCTMVHRETFMICVSERVRKAGIRLSPYLR